MAGRKEKWEIPEVIERELLKPVADMVVQSFKQDLPDHYDYEVSLDADTDRVNGNDYIVVDVIDLRGIEETVTAIYQMPPPKDPEEAWRNIHG